jgi:hypothetical protein
VKRRKSRGLDGSQEFEDFPVEVNLAYLVWLQRGGWLAFIHSLIHYSTKPY